jgi:hypothetical protein
LSIAAAIIVQFCFLLVVGGRWVSSVRKFYRSTNQRIANFS